MAKVKVKVGMYQATDYCETYGAGAVVSIEEYNEIVKSKTVELKANDSEFSDYLWNNYTMKEIWDATEGDKAKIRKDYEERCVNWAKDDLDREWEYLEIETEVDIPAVACPCKQ